MAKEIICGIYKITSPSGKIYIGQSVDIKETWSQRYKKLNCKSQTLIYKSLKKYGYEQHLFEIVRVCSEKWLNVFEIYFINFYGSFNSKTGLNLTSGGNSGRRSDYTKKRMSMAGLNMSQDHKNKLSDAHLNSSPMRGKKHSAETKDKMSKSHLGVPKSNDTIIRMRLAQAGENNPMYGRVLTDEHRRNISIANTGKEVSPERKEKLMIANKGKTIPVEVRNKISTSLRGISQSDESKLKKRMAMIGKKDSDEVRKKKSVTKLGLLNPMYGKPSPMRGKNHSEKTKKLWSEKRKGRRQAGKLVINLTTGVFYRSAIEAFETLGFGNLNSFKNRLRGTTKNNTGFIYV